MNCQLCQEKSDAYFGGMLPPDMRIQVEDHLVKCSGCAEIYRIEAVAMKVIGEEKKILPNPFLATRIMTRIESAEAAEALTTTSLKGIVRPALMTLSLAAAIFLGVVLGNIYNDSPESVHTIPVELSLMDDAAIESIDALSTE